MMWIVLALLAAVFSGLSVIFQKQGMSGKTMQVSAMSNTAGFAVMLAAVLLERTWRQMPGITVHSLVLAVSSGVIQALSWLTYFMALKDARVNAMMALDKINIVAAMLLSYFILGEAITGWMILGCALILLGSVLMTGKEEPADGKTKKRTWVVWAVVSPSLQALANVLAKLDTSETDATLIAALRTLIVIAVLWLVSFWKEGKPDIRRMISGRMGFNLLMGGVMIGISYIFMYQAIHDGINAVVAPIVKMNFLISTAAACIFLHEKISKAGIVGFAAVFGGVMMFLL